MAWWHSKPIGSVPGRNAVPCVCRGNANNANIWQGAAQADCVVRPA